MPQFLQLARVVSQPFAENTYFLWRENSQECVVVDPGFAPDVVAAEMDSRGLIPAAILNTHGHSDHIAGNAALKQAWPDIPLIIGEGDADKLTDPVGNLSAGFGLDISSPPADKTVVEGDTVAHAGIVFEVLETPGHSSGHVVFVVYNHDQTVIIGGDVLFQGGVGRTDFPDSNTQDLIDSIQQKLFRLPADAVVLPGHGPETTIQAEIETNPWVGIPAGFKPA